MNLAHGDLSRLRVREVILVLRWAFVFGCLEINSADETGTVTARPPVTRLSPDRPGHGPNGLSVWVYSSPRTVTIQRGNSWRNPLGIREVWCTQIDIGPCLALWEADSFPYPSLVRLA